MIKKIKLSVKGQISILFVVISLLLILQGYLNYTTVENFDKTIQSVRNKTIEQLVMVGIIGLNTGNNEIYVLNQLYASRPERKTYYENKINELIAENDSLYNTLTNLIVRESTHDSLNTVLMARELYLMEVRKAIDVSNKEKEALPFEYEEKNIRPVFENYRQKLNQFSLLIIKNAERDLELATSHIYEVKYYTNLIIGFGVLILIISSLFILKIYKRLTHDFLLLQKETEARRNAQAELQLLNEELEIKVKERTAALEDAYRDISVYNDKLKELSSTKDKLIAVISHDLRNPLSIIITSSDFLTKSLGQIKGLDGEVKQFAEIINRATNKVINQLNELVERAKLRDPKRMFEPVRLNLLEISSQSLQLIEASARQKKIVLRNEVSASDYVTADKFMLRSIIQNLVSNAIKFTPEGGIVSVKAVRKNGMEEIRITDTGIGVKPEVIEKIFREGSSVSTKGTAMEKGSGLGLKLVKDFVDELGGTIRVESLPGKGSSFILTVPSEN